MTIEFTNCGIQNKNCYGMLFPMSSFQLLIFELFEIEEKINYQSISQKSSVIITQNIPKNIPNQNKIQEIIKQINNFGFGEFIIKNIAKNKIIISQNKTYLSKIFEQVYHKKSKLISEKIIGNLLRNCLENIFSSKIKFEIKINNKQEVLFIYSLEKKVSNQITNNKTTIIAKQISNPIIAKIKHEKQLIIKNGILTLWKTSGIFIPYNIISEIFSLLKEKDSKKLERIAMLQLYSAVQLQKNVFGIKDNEKIFSFLIPQTLLIGMGNVTIIKKENSQISLQLENKIFNYLSPDKVELLKYFYKFILKGIIEFGLEVESEINSKINNNITKFNLISKGRSLSPIEKELSNYLSANIQINKFI